MSWAMLPLTKEHLPENPVQAKSGSIQEATKQNLSKSDAS